MSEIVFFELGEDFKDPCTKVARPARKKPPIDVDNQSRYSTRSNEFNFSFMSVTSGNCDSHLCECQSLPDTEVDRRRFSKTRCRSNYMWQEILKARKEIHARLSAKTKRPPGKLLMNISEELTQLNDDRILLSYLSKYVAYKKMNGNPAFWHVTPSFGFPEGPRYYVHEPAIELNEIPKLTYGGTPDLIKKEKDILPRVRNLYKKWTNNEYRKDRLQKFAKTLKLIQPHRPEIKDLIIVGQKIEIPKEEQDVSNEDKEVQLEEKISHVKLQVSPERIKLIIHGLEFSNEYKYEVGSRRIRVVFDYNTLSNKPMIVYLNLENYGNTTIRLFFWHKKKVKLFSDIYGPDTRKPVFFFDKNPLLLLAGQQYKLPIIFYSKDIGTFWETWNIETLPPIWEKTFKLEMVLQATSQENDITEFSKEFLKNLEDRAKNNFVKDIFKELCDNMKYRDTEILTYHYTEKDLFEAANMGFNFFVRKPLYVYDKEVVEELKTHYATIRKLEHDNKWNLSVRMLQILSREKDLYDYCDKFRIQKSNRLKGTKDFSVESCEQFQTHMPGKGKMIEEELFTLEESAYSKLDNILSKLDRYSMEPNLNRIKYLHAYFIMRNYMTKLSEALVKIDSIHGYPNRRRYPKNLDENPESKVLPDRQIYERFEDYAFAKRSRLRKGDSFIESTPKPEFLSKIPSNDYNGIIKQYFQKDDKIKKRSDINYNDIPLPTEHYVPPKNVTTDNTEPEEVLIPFDDSYLHYEIYITVHHYVTTAIYSIIDMLESFKTITFPTYLLKEVIESQANDNLCLFESKEQTKLIKKKAMKLRSIDSYQRETRASSPQVTQARNFFNYLLKMHWKQNPNTIAYYVNGLTNPSKLDPDLKSAWSCIQIEKLYNISTFHDVSDSSFDKEEELFDSKSEQFEMVQNAEVQTEGKPSISSSIKPSTKKESVSAEKMGGVVDEISPSTSERFFYLDNDEISLLYHKYQDKKE